MRLDSGARANWLEAWAFHPFRQKPEVVAGSGRALAGSRADDQFLQMENGSPIRGCALQVSCF